MCIREKKNHVKEELKEIEESYYQEMKKTKGYCSRRANYLINNEALLVDHTDPLKWVVWHFSEA